MKTSFVALMLFLLSSCSTVNRKEKVTPRKFVTLIPEQRIISQKVSTKQSATKKKDFKLEYSDARFKFWKNYFQKRNKEGFLKHLRRGSQYQDVITHVMNKYGLPKDLFYVGLIESGYGMQAKSSASAVGPWQFMKGTGKMYGLKVNNRIDERQNIYKATEAAAKYFQDLYNIFGSWDLALSGYNAGEYRIIKAIRKGNTRSYKELVRKKLIPKETINYVPKIAAAKYVAERMKSKWKNHKRSLTATANYIKMYKSFSVSKLARDLSIPIGTLKRYNTDLRKDWIAKQSGGVRVFIPNVSIPKRLVASLKKDQRIAESISKTTYKVRKGDNLGKISRKFGVSISKLKRANRIRRSNTIRIGQRLTIPKDAYAGSSTREPSSVSSFVATNYYRVKKGDSLIRIALKNNMTLAQIKKLNNLKSGKILIGQRLSVRSKTSKSKVYIVKRGDNLTKISERFGISLSSLLSYNSLNNKRIFPRQRLKIPSGS